MKEESKFLSFIHPDQCTVDLSTVRKILLRLTMFDKENAANEGSEKMLPSLFEA